MSTTLTCERSEVAFEQTLDFKLFPLPTTVFEEYMLLDDSTTFPMDVFHRFRFLGGRFDLDAFRRAVEWAVARHPLFGCRVEKRGKRYFWVPYPDASLAFQAFRREDVNRNVADANDRSSAASTVQADVDPFFADVRPICLARENGLRIVVVWDERGADVVIQTHHAVADGAGLGAFFRDVFCEYATLVGAISNVVPPPVDFNALKRRGKFGLTLKSYLRNYYYTTKSTLRFLFVNPRPVFTPLRRSAARVPNVNVFREFNAKNFDVEPEVCRRVDLIATELTDEETRRCAESAKRAGVTLNDLLVAGFSAAIDRRRRLRGEPIRGVDRIAVPMNLRNKNHRDAPACNIVTMAFLDLPAKIRREPAGLLRETNRRMNEIKRRDQKHFLDLVLKTGRFLAGTFGGDLSLFLKTSRRRATATFSNLGRILSDVPLDRTADGRLRIGALVLDSIINFAPIRSESVVSVAASTYANRLTFSLRYDLNYLTPKEAAEFLDDLRGACAFGFAAASENDSADRYTADR